MIRLAIASLLLLFGFATAQAGERIVEGSALIRNGDISEARESATRRALARAAESRAATVSAQTMIGGGMALESSQVSATACVRDVQQVDERIRNNELTVTLKLTVLEEASCNESCRPGYLNRVVVTGFAFEFPEQLHAAEQQRIEQLTANEIARAIGRRDRLLAAHQGSAFPYASASRAPEAFVRADDVETPFAALARSHRAQYVLSGVYREFGFRSKRSRHIEIEAYLHDGMNGALLATQRFARTVNGAVIVTDQPAIGTQAFYAGDFGRGWGSLVDDMTRWTERRAGCLPFVARVVRTEGGLLHLDAGAESRLSVGDSLNLHVRQEGLIRDLSDHLLGEEKRVRATAIIRSVYPQFSVAELIEAPADLLVKKGDLLYAQ